MTALDVRLAAPGPAAADVPRRRITGLIVSWADVARTSAGPTRFTRGALAWSDPRRVALLREHDRTTPLGHAVELTDSPAGVLATFYLPPGPDGDRALTEAATGLRSGLSVGAELDDVTLDADGVLVVSAARLREVSQVSVPAYDSARITHVAAAAPRPPEGHPPVTQPTPPAPPAEPQQPPAQPQQPPPAPPAEPQQPPPAPPAEPQQPPAQPPADVRAGWVPAARSGAPAPRELTLAGLSQLVASAWAGHAAPGELRAALADVVPANGAPFFRPTYLTELWDGAAATRPLIDAVTTRPLPRAMKITAHRWVTRPQVGDYAGSKAEVPSNPVAMEDVEVTVQRTAGAHDVDRAFIDLGSPDYLASYFQAMTDSYRRQTEAKLAAYLAAEATAIGGAAPDTLLDGVTTAVIELAAAGESADFVALSGELVRELLSISALDAPAYYGGAFSLRGGTDGTLGGLRFITTPALPAGTFLVGARSAAIWWEANPPVRVSALDVAHGGVDVGVFGYHAAAVVNPAALRRGALATPPA